MITANNKKPQNRAMKKGRLMAGSVYSERLNLQDYERSSYIQVRQVDNLVVVFKFMNYV
jgi:hypothetical protein